MNALAEAVLTLPSGLMTQNRRELRAVLGDCFGGVYCIRHEPSGREYIGKSQDITKRLSDHRAWLVQAKRGAVGKCGPCKSWMAADCARDGLEAFTWRVLEELDPRFYDDRAMRKREGLWMVRRVPEYNDYAPECSVFDFPNWPERLGDDPTYLYRGRGAGWRYQWRKFADPDRAYIGQALAERAARWLEEIMKETNTPMTGI